MLLRLILRTTNFTWFLQHESSQAGRSNPELIKAISAEVISPAFGAPSTASARWENPPPHAETVLGTPVLQRFLFGLSAERYVGADIRRLFLLKSVALFGRDLSLVTSAPAQIGIFRHPLRLSAEKLAVFFVRAGCIHRFPFRNSSVKPIISRRFIPAPHLVRGVAGYVTIGKCGIDANQRTVDEMRRVR